MSWLGAFMERRSVPRLGSATALADPGSDLYRWFTGGGADSLSGVTVTPESALEQPAVYRGVDVRASMLATVPLKVRRRRKGGGSDEAREHALWPILHDSWSVEETSAAARRRCMVYLLLFGAAGVEIERTRGGVPVALWPRHPNRVKPERQNGRLVYRITNQTKPDAILDPSAMLYVTSLSMDGITGLNPVNLMRETIGLGKAAAEFGAAFFGNGASMSGVLSFEGAVTPDRKDKLRADINAEHQGVERSHRILVADQGASFKPMSVPPDSSQFNETRRLQVTEQARLVGVPPHIVADLEKASFATLEQQFLELVVLSLRPVAVYWEQEYNRKLLTPAERDSGLYIEHNLDGLMRGDSEARSAFYQAGILNGWLTRADARDIEGYNPIPGLERPLVPQNMAQLDEEGNIVEPPGGATTAPAPPPGPGGTAEPNGGRRSAMVIETPEKRSLDARWRLRATFETLLTEAAGRVVTAEVRAIRKHLEDMPDRGVGEFRQWLDVFLRQHEEFFGKVMGPVLRAYLLAVAAEIVAEMEADEAALKAELDRIAADYAAAAARQHTGVSRTGLTSMLEGGQSPEDAAEALSGVLDGWEQTRAGKMGASLSVDGGGAMASLAYALMGVSVLVWAANRGACPICQQLDGLEAEIGREFARPGDSIDPQDGKTAPLVVQQVIRHPPAHTGCNCSVRPG